MPLDPVNCNVLDNDTRLALDSIDRNFVNVQDQLDAKVGGGGVGAPDSLPYVTIGNSALLSAERALAVGTSLGISDGGANSVVTLTRAALTGDVTASANSNATTLVATAAVIEIAQDAAGAMVGASLVYDDATPLLSRAALTGDVTAAANSNATTLVNTAAVIEIVQDIVGNASFALAGEGIDVVYDDGANTLTVSGEDASDTNKGIASFAPGDFTATAGDISLANGAAMAIDSATVNGATLTEQFFSVTLTRINQWATASSEWDFWAAGKLSVDTDSPSLRFRLYHKDIASTRVLLFDSGNATTSTLQTDKPWIVNVRMRINTVGAAGSMYCHGWHHNNRIMVLDRELVTADNDGTSQFELSVTFAGSGSDSLDTATLEHFCMTKMR